MRCPRCGQENPGEARFCLHCGAPLSLSCPSCGAVQPRGARFCPECGRAVTAAPSPEGYTPAYIREQILAVRGAVEGERKHAIAHYLDLVVAGRVDLRPMLTHTFRLERWRDAFLAIADQGESGAVKVAFDFR